jgi:hypothetical protein
MGIVSLMPSTSAGPVALQTCSQVECFYPLDVRIIANLYGFHHGQAFFHQSRFCGPL